VHVNPKHLKLLQKAQALNRSRKVPEASAAYREFLNREPKHAETWANYAMQLLKLDQFEEAQKACETALEINPYQLPARINLGCILMGRARLDEAESQFRSVLKADPRRMDAQLFLVECLLNRKDLPGVQKALDGANEPGAMKGRYSVLRPRLAELWALFGLALLEEQTFRPAEKACNTALQVDPTNFRAKANLGSILMAQGRLDEAEGVFRRLLADHPHEEKLRLLLITCLARSGDPGPTLHEIDRVLRQAPTSFLVHKSVMGPYYSLGCWDEYKAEIERFRKVDPASAYLDYEQSFVDLLFGDMPQGWARFEARLNVGKDLRPQRTFSQPAWSGESFAGKTLLIWAEQGLGDTLMFLRYLPLVKALGGQVLLEVQPGLMDLAATCKGSDLVIPTDAALPSFDLQVSIMSLPWVFRTGLATIPADVPYLRVPGRVAHRQVIQEVLAPAQDYTRIGLVWAGNPNHARDHERSLPAPFLTPLGALPGAAWFSFQLGRPELPPLPNLVSLAPLLDDFSDTAYALSTMDLLITVDTAMVHLAGALGIPTLLLVTHQPDYRWMLDRDDSPWYPTLRIYRQPAYGDWESVIQQVFRDLTQDS
jgi:tetratricopeptide (TPR) repeat protein